MLVVSHLYPLEREPGLGIFVTRELGDLAPHGLEFEVLVPRPWAPWPLSRLGRWRQYAASNRLAGPAAIPARVVRYPRLPGFGFRRLEGAVLAPALRAAARRAHRERAFDLVLAIGIFPSAEASCGVAEALGIPLAAMAVGSDVMVMTDRAPYLQQRLQRIAARAALCVGVSEMLCERLRAAGARDPLRVCLGRDTALFRPAEDREALRRELGWAPGDVVGAFVGALWRGKGMDELAQVMPGLLRASPELRLVCVGQGEAAPALRAAAAAAGRPDALLLPGHVPPIEVPRYLQAADFLVFPSHSEGLPQAVLEAMNCGLPVIATRVGGIPEAVVDGETGILIEPRAPEQLRAEIERMTGDPALRERLGRAGLERAREHFDPAAEARRLAGALRERVARG